MPYEASRAGVDQAKLAVKETLANATAVSSLIPKSAVRGSHNLIHIYSSKTNSKASRVGCAVFSDEQFLQYQRERGYFERNVGNRENLLITFIRWYDERGLTRPQEVTRPISERYQRHLFCIEKLTTKRYQRAAKQCVSRRSGSGSSG